MGIRFTKYETSTDIVFDVSKFDYSYDDDTFPTDTQEDFETIVDEIGGTFTIQTEEDVVDGMGNVVSITSSTFSITGYIQDITKKDFKIHEMGLAVPGNRILYVKVEYNTDDVVKEGQILIDRKGYYWRIEKIIHEPFLNKTEIYKKAIVKSIGLEGSV